MRKLEKIYTNEYYAGSEIRNLIVDYVLKMIRSEFKNKDIYLLALTELLDKLVVEGNYEENVQ